MHEFEVILPRSALPQPKPNIVLHGDCGACVLGGLANITHMVAYLTAHAVPCAFSFDDMAQALASLQDERLLDRVVEDSPCWIQPLHQAHCGFGFTSLSQAPMWYDYVRLALDAGYYGLCTISYDPVATKPSDTYFSTNHWVLIKGCRFRWVPMDLGRRGVEEILVSCSNKGDYWIAVREFARLHGGMNILLARPAH